LCWFHRDESLERPNLGPVVVEDGVVEGPTLGVLFAPPGWLPSGGGTGMKTGVAAAAEQDLARAEAQLQLSRGLPLPPTGPALNAAQQRFALYCRRVELALNLIEGGERSETEKRLQTLRREDHDLARSGRFEPLVVEAENEAKRGSAFPPLPAPAGLDAPSPLWGPIEARVFPSVTPPERGTPYYWTATAGASLPEVFVRPAPERATAPGKWPLLGVLTAAWLLSLLPFVRSGTRLFKLELLALLGVLGWQLAGFTPVVATLLGIWALGRAITLARALSRLPWRRPAPPARVGSST
jgi:hypothetical protein